MVDFQARCTLRSVNGVPADDCINTFAFVADPLSDIQLLADAFANFWNSSSTGQTNAVGEYINDSILRSDGLLVEIIQSPQTPPNPPIGGGIYDLVASGSPVPVPQEVALCLSMHTANYLTSATPGRERGRVYVGPLNTLAEGDPGTNQVSRPTDIFMQDVVFGINAVYESLVLNDAFLAIWSRAAGTLSAVTGGWVDNEWDTQRRRGRPATGRTNYSLPL